MTCRDTQADLSLYLYGELEFAREEAVEQHLAGCAFCRSALDREKAWHGIARSEAEDAPVQLLAECRSDLKQALARSKRGSSFAGRWAEFLPSFDFNRWSLRLAMASALVFIGFASARWLDQHGSPLGVGGASMMSLVGPSGATAIREVRPNGPNAVRIVVEQVGEREITGNPEDETIRRLLLAGMSDPLDPGVRIDAVQSLAGQPGNDVKQALLHSVRNDPNAAVRLKALDALGRFAPDTETQDTLKYVLQHDDDAAVRSEAIDLLAPVNHPLTPEMAATLESVLRSGQQDDYVRARCVQILREVGLSPDLY